MHSAIERKTVIRERAREFLISDNFHFFQTLETEGVFNRKRFY